MAFVPKTINREVPISNQTVATRSQQETHGRHLRNLYEMGPTVDTRWGGIRNGVREQKQPMYTHVRANLKRAQIQDERFAEIELENTVLLGKLSKILRRSRNPTVGTRDWTGGLRLTPNQVPVIDHWISADTTAFGAAVEPSSLNLARRRQERERIEVENRALVARLQSCKPTYDNTKLDADDSRRQKWLASHSMPRPPSPIGSRVATADASVGSSGSAPLPGVPGGSASGRRQLPPLGSRGTVSAGGRPGKGKGKAGGGASSGVDAAVLSVLDLLSRHMRGASSSLAEMRVARDSLMETVLPLGANVTVSTIDAGGVPTELVTHERAAASLREYAANGSSSSLSQPSLIVLVHGGMFVTGSPRAGRHLAAKLSELTGVPVATPTLRLAPEHPYPAALDDLAAAYAALGAMSLPGTDGVNVTPHQIALFAESSGGALALSMLSRQSSAPLGSRKSRIDPTAIVLASPWLDMTCSGQSYVANEARDPVMQRKRLVGIARAYLGEGTAASDPSVSPVLGNAPAFIGLPPTLVQVGISEVLVDDSYELESLAKAAGADVRVQLWDGVLHAWHTFFPLMPRALDALHQAAHFLCDSLQLPPPPKAEFQAPKGAGYGGDPGAGGDPFFGDDGDEAARAAAAIKLQAITRGRASRKDVTAKKRTAVVPSAPTTVKWTAKYDEQQAIAATKVQATMRGRNARKDVSSTYGSAGLSEHRAIKRRELEVKAAGLGYAEAHGRGGVAMDMKNEEALEAQRQLAATRVQAIARGRKTRQQDWLTPNTDEYRKAAGKEKAPDFTATNDQDLAATRLQSQVRARNERKVAQAEQTERNEAATKLAAARRGQQERKRLAAEKAEQADAAAKLQKIHRGKQARQEAAALRSGA